METVEFEYGKASELDYSHPVPLQGLVTPIIFQVGVTQTGKGLDQYPLVIIGYSYSIYFVFM